MKKISLSLPALLLIVVSGCEWSKVSMTPKRAISDSANGIDVEFVGSAAARKEPSVTITSGPSGFVNQSSVQFTFSGVGTFECRMDSAAYADCVSPASYSGLVQGPHVFSVRARSGRMISSDVTRAFTVDSVAPVITKNSFPTSANVGDVVTFNFSATDATSGIQSVTCQMDSGAAQACMTSISYTGLTAGSHTLTINARDNAGNSSSLISTLVVNAVAPSPSPSPTAAGSTVTSVQLTSALSGIQPFTIGVALKKGDVFGNLSANLPNVQVDIKRLWSDNSIKHAVLSGRASFTAGQPLTINLVRSTPPAGTALVCADINNAAPQASIDFGAYGKVELGSLLGSPVKTWLSGREVVECHYRSPVGSDPTLVAAFHVRLYAGGKIRIRAIAENGYLDVTTADKSYVPQVMIGGASVYNNGGIALNHYDHTRWSVEGWIGGADPQVVPKQNTDYLIETRLVPNYWKRNPSATRLNALYQNYQPMQKGDQTQTMGNTGFQAGIGILPDWDALYVSSGDARAFRSALANSSALNSYAILWRDSKTGNAVRPSDYPTWTVYGPNGGGVNGLGSGDLIWEQAHHPSGGYVAYIATGDYWHLETMALQSATNYVTCTSARGSGTNRILKRQIRGIAWALRTLGQYAALAPAGDSVAEDYRALLGNNYAYWAVRAPYNDQASQIGYPISVQSYDATKPLSVAPWQYHFWMGVNGFLSDLDTDISNPNDLFAVRDFMYKGAVGILGGPTIDNYCFTKASRYTITISNEVVSQTAEVSADRFLPNWGEVFLATTGVANTACGNSLEGTSGGSPSGASGGYYGNLMPAIAYAVDHGASGAAASWNRFTGATNFNLVADSGFDDRPIWGIVPHGWTGGAVTEPSPSPTSTASPSPTPTATSSPSPTPTTTSSPSPTPAPTATSSPSPTPAPTATSSPSPTPAPTATSSPSPAPISNSVLSQAAATLSAGQSVKLNTTLPGSVLIYGTEASNFIQWGSSGVYDPTRKEVRFIGKRHSVYPYHVLVYDEATNSWSNDRPAWSTAGAYGHGYDHNAIDPETGIHYFRHFNSALVRVWNGSWSSLPTWSGTSTGVGGLTWFPGLGLVYNDGAGIRYFNGVSWQLIQSFGGNSYHDVSEYNETENVLIFGSGNSSILRKMTSDFAITTVANPPFNIGAASNQGVVISDPRSGNLIAYQKGTSNWAQYNIASDLWSPLIPTSGSGSSPENGVPKLAADSNQSVIGIPIPAYGVIMFVQYTGASSLANVWLYKHRLP